MKYMQIHTDPVCSRPHRWSACMRMYLPVCCAYVVHMLNVCCMYVHMCAYLYVSMRLATFAAKNTCTYAHTYTYSTSYMHIHFKYKQTYARHKAVHILFVFIRICMYMSVSCLYLMQYRMYVKNYVKPCLYQRPLHVCACIYLYLLEIRGCIGWRGEDNWDGYRSYSSSVQSIAGIASTVPGHSRIFTGIWPWPYSAPRVDVVPLAGRPRPPRALLLHTPQRKYSMIPPAASLFWNWWTFDLILQTAWDTGRYFMICT